MTTKDLKINPKLDLIFERTPALSIEKIWQAWTQPEILVKWFCPRPWKVTECRVDLRPGGEFYTLMQSPEGQKFPNNGVFLEVVKNQKLVWTNMMSEGYRPVQTDKMGFAFTATLLLTPTKKGTHYQAVVSHADEEGLKKHEQMNFQEGWGQAFNQLLELF